MIVASDAARPGGAFVTRTVTVADDEVRYVEAGTGDDVLVVCPGSAGADASWAKDLLAERMRVIELNPPGWGGTPQPPQPRDQRELATVLAQALTAIGVERFHLHGASMGGVTALWIAAQAPDRVRTVSMEGSMAFAREDDFRSPENIRVLADMVARGDPEGIGYPRAAPHPRKPWADDEFIRGQMRKRIPMMRMLTHRHEDELIRRLRDAHLPLLVLLGDEDELLREENLERWAELFPDAATVLVHGGAHDIQNTEPEQLVRALRELHASAAG